jgi:LacI family transcriptional regulator
MPHRVTLRQIARESGYHFTTVSLALREHSSIPESTRAKILAIAKRLDYRPDPVLSALNAYRRGVSRPEYAGTILWLENYTSEYHWRKIPMYRDYFEGAREYATTLGYRIDPFQLNQEAMTTERANQILAARRAQALLIPPQPEPGVRIDLAWEQLSAVAFGYTVEHPQLHVVSNNHTWMMTRLLDALERMGYRRPGLVLLRQSSERVENKWLGAFLASPQHARRGARVTPLLLDAWDGDAVLRWYRRRQPDVIISGIHQLPELLTYLRESGVRIPDDVGFADHNLFDSDSEVAGMLPRARAIGQAAVQMLVGMVYRNEVGIPESPQNLLINGVWQEAETVRPQNRSTDRVPVGTA